MSKYPEKITPEAVESAAEAGYAAMMERYDRTHPEVVRQMRESNIPGTYETESLMVRDDWRMAIRAALERYEGFTKDGSNRTK